MDIVRWSPFRGISTSDVERWSPLREFEALERRMRRLMEDAGFAPTVLPAADVYETDSEFVAELEVPGFEVGRRGDGSCGPHQG